MRLARMPSACSARRRSGATRSSKVPFGVEHEGAELARPRRPRSGGACWSGGRPRARRPAAGPGRWSPRRPARPAGPPPGRRPPTRWSCPPRPSRSRRPLERSAASSARVGHRRRPCPVSPDPVTGSAARLRPLDAGGQGARQMVSSSAGPMVSAKTNGGRAAGAGAARRPAADAAAAWSPRRLLRNAGRRLEGRRPARGRGRPRPRPPPRPPGSTCQPGLVGQTGVHDHRAERRRPTRSSSW